MDTPLPEPPAPETPSSQEDDATDQSLDETYVPGESDPGNLDEMAQDDAAARKQTTEKAEGDKPRSKNKASQLGDFKLLKKLGEGGMGEVYLARQQGLDRNVALKVLSKQLGKKSTFVERFFREARAMARLDHPNVLKVFAVETDQGRHYVAIEYVDGQSMQDWVDQLGRLTVADSVLVAIHCAEALLHAHQAKLVHRDVKPDNVLVTRSGLVKVADFGLAKAADEDVSMTQSGTGMGTPLYMAPEQARNAKAVDLRADIYALGCSLYHFLTGELPFQGDSALELVTAKEKGLFTSARKLNSDIPDRLDLIIDRMIARDPDHRHADCSELLDQLNALGLAGDTLSFIDGAQPASGSRTGSRSGSAQHTAPTSKPKSSIPAVTLPPPSSAPSSAPSSTDDAAAQRATAADADNWFIQHTNAKGRTVVSRMTTDRIRKAIDGKLIDLKAKAKQNQNDSFMPLVQFAEFEPAIKKRLSQARSGTGSGLQDIYHKLDKQHHRRRKLRALNFLFRTAMGWVWLTVFLAVLVGLGLAAWFHFDDQSQQIKDWFN